MIGFRQIQIFTFTLVILVLTFFVLSGQTYYASSFGQLLKVELNEGVCDCEVIEIGPYFNGFGGMTFSPEGDLYYLQDIGDYQQIQQVDTLTGTLISTLTTGPYSERPKGGIVGVGNGIFYVGPPLQEIFEPSLDTLYRWNTNTNTVTALGNTGYGNSVEMCTANGVMYYNSYDQSEFL